MKSLPAFILIAGLAGAVLVPGLGYAAPLNLATLSCGKYENEILPAAAAEPTADSLNVVMWLLGYSVAMSGAHHLYPDALSPFGFALDGECKTNPTESVLDALAIVKAETKNPMDLTAVQCSAFASRHQKMAASDPESATTIMMWLFGFSVAKSGSHLFDASAVDTFQAALLADCAKHPDASLFDTLRLVKMYKPPKAAVHPPS